MPDKVRPIKPGDVAAEKARTFPDAVLSSFNELIIQKWDGSSATIRQSEVVALMVKKGLKREEVFGKGWLVVKDTYESVGWSVSLDWSVECDMPRYNKSYPTTFIFKHKRKS